MIRIKRLPHAKDLPLPYRATSGSAGIDLYAARDVTLRTSEWQLVPTGVIVQLPEGYEGQIRPRSGLALKNGITVLNAPGTIDSDFRSEIGVILINYGTSKDIKRGERIAQLVVAPVSMLPICEVDEVTETERGAGGFGSTGTT